MVRKVINRRTNLCIKDSTHALAPGHGWALKCLPGMFSFKFILKNESADLRVCIDTYHTKMSRRHLNTDT